MRDLDEMILRARLRRERRLAEVMRLQSTFPTRELWRTLDLVHEATRLVDDLETVYQRRADEHWYKMQEGVTA